MQNETNWYIIVNPAAGNGVASRLWPNIKPVLLDRIPNATIVHTEYPDHAIELVESAVKSGFRYFIAVGGDGTNHEMANGILQQKIVPSTEITYALLPVGTGNDWIKTYGIPKNINQWLDMLLRGNTFLQDVGILDYHKEGQKHLRYFVNVAGLAYDGFVVHFIERNKKKVKNSLFYLFMIVRCIFRYNLIKARITFNGQEDTGYHYTINAGICKYSGGGMSLVPHAISNDGLIALTIAHRVTKLGVLLNSWRFYNDSITRHRKIQGFQTKEIFIAEMGEGPLLLEADGEFLGHTPVRITLQEKAFRIIVP
ncbi:MAG: diacylglycerol kinase family lipid kinase [Saprospiraceae bacterium]|nr:diacylglycerol kinase family lipid kinase [Saprospiraceae bacterium]MCB9324762.1 diacylglycerol kinase family lipid kinase [Lewinellaceae bacterium]